MKILPFLLCFFISTTLVGQNWFSEDDQWVEHGVLGGFWEFRKSYVQTNFEKDTLINEVQYSKLKRVLTELSSALDTVSSTLDPLLLRETDEKVYYLNEGNEYLIYDFTMLPGDSITWLDEDLGCPRYFHLDSTYEISIEGVPVRVQAGKIKGYYQWPITLGVGSDIRIYEGVGIAELFSVHDSSWFFAGGLMPYQIFTCIQDVGLPYLCYFSNDEYALGEADNCFDLSIPIHPWFNLQDEWKLSYGYFSSPAISHKIFSYEKDTLIGDQSFTKLSNTNYHLQGTSDTIAVLGRAHYMHQEGDRIHYRNGDSTYLVYDFSMVKGDTLWYRPSLLYGTPEEEDCEYYFVLDSVKVEDFTWYPLRVQRGSLYGPYFYDGSLQIEIVETMGWVRYYHSELDEWLLGGHLIPDYVFSCYIVDGVGPGDFCEFSRPQYSYGGDCIELASSVHELDQKHSNKLAPNPMTSEFRLLGDISDYDSYSIYDISGKKVKVGFLNNEILDVSGIEVGIHYLQLEGNRSVSKTLKFVKIE